MKNVLKRSLSVFLAVIIVFSSVLVGFNEFDLNSFFVVKSHAASSGTCGAELTWSLADNGTFTISGTGEMTDYLPCSAPWYYLSESIRDVVISDGVTSIGDYAFPWCTYLESVEISDTVMSIGEGVFYDCKKLYSVTLGENVTSIERDAFSFCNSLKSIVIPSSVTYIADAFGGCDSLTAINVNENNTCYCSVNGVLFNKDKTTLVKFPEGKSDTKYTIPSSVISIGGWAFSGCGNLTSITIPNSVINIGDWAFNGCEGLASIVIPNSVTSMGDNVFSSEKLKLIIVDSKNSFYSSVDGVLFNKDKTKLIRYPKGKTDTKYIIPSTVTSIGEDAFYECTNLTAIEIPNSVVNIGETAFYNCNGITSIIIPDSVTSIGKQAFGDCTNLKSVKMSSNITSISSYVFFGCTKLTSITIPNSVTDIGYSAFSNCTSLTSLIIPDGVKSIGDYAFAGCTNLASIIIPDSVACICKEAFNNTSYYNNTNNWENNVLYINNHLIKANTSISGNYSIKEGTKTIADYAFYNCTSLGSTSIPDSVTTVGEYAFYNCTGFTSIIIPDSVKGIGEGAFYNCTNLASIKISDYATGIGEGSFINTSYYDNSANWEDDVLYIGKHLIAAKSSISGKYTIKTGTKTIAAYVFYNCYKLSSIALPNSITNIGEGAFIYCGGLSSVTIPNSVTNIGERAFYHCTSLKSVTIPDSVTSIGDTAFGYYYDSEQGLAVRISNFTIRGVSKTAAETYAKENGFAFIINCEHVSTKWVTDKKATVNAKGKKHKECIECGEVLETATIKQLKCSKPKLKEIENTTSGVKITWGKVSGADKYYVYRKVKGGSYSKIGTTTKTSYTDKTAKSGKKYYYIVKAINEAGASSSSSALSKLYLADPTLKTPTSTKSGVSLKWTKSAGAEGYIIYRKTGSGSYTKLKTENGVSNLSYVDKSAKKGKKYTYKVKAYYSKTYSAYSNTKSITDKY